MAITDLSSIESVLAQMRQVAQAAGNTTRTEAGPAAPGGFAAELQRSLQNVSNMERNATDQAKAFALGEPGVSLNNAMIDLQKASLAFQATIQVRNRVIAAYQEIASMPV